MPDSDHASAVPGSAEWWKRCRKLGEYIKDAHDRAAGRVLRRLADQTRNRAASQIDNPQPGASCQMPPPVQLVEDGSPRAGTRVRHKWNGMEGDVLGLWPDDSSMAVVSTAKGRYSWHVNNLEAIGG